MLVCGPCDDGVCFWTGMGVTTITAARILKGQLQNRSGEETVMNMDTFPYVGLAKVSQTGILKPVIGQSDRKSRPQTHSIG